MQFNPIDNNDLCLEHQNSSQLFESSARAYMTHDFDVLVNSCLHGISPLKQFKSFFGALEFVFE